MKFGVVIVGAGKGERLGRATPKCMVKIDKVPLLLLSVWVFEQSNDIESIVLVVPPGYEKDIDLDIKQLRFQNVTSIVPGAERRQDSVLHGIQALSRDIDRVIIHDGARPLLSTDVLNRFLTALKEEQSVFVGIPVTDTLHKNIEGYAQSAPNRIDLIAAQTPQGFDRSLLLEAFFAGEERQLTVTDEATLVRETMDVSVRIVEGEIMNVKITRPEDLELYNLPLKTRVREMRGF
ncbi:2-C-methyl-D-erythritol 4-phosphate cytidylyltransferase [bacterium]|nr:2-C-methyl-D-erythritol 4-phosphate cytidylyltransferase [bacterium]